MGFCCGLMASISMHKELGSGCWVLASIVEGGGFVIGSSFSISASSKFVDFGAMLLPQRTAYNPKTTKNTSNNTVHNYKHKIKMNINFPNKII